MEERKKHKVMIGIEVILLCMMVAVLGTNAASSNPPSSGVSYSKNSQTTVEGALNDLYTKANYGNATASQILKGKTALVGGKKVTGTMVDRGTHQYGSWGCGAAGCGSGNDAYYAIHALPEGYYHSDGYSWAPEARISANTLRTSLGITASKILKGQSIAGVTGTGETTCPTLTSQTSSATAGVGDILSGKTAYVNGNKITGNMANKGAVSGTISPGGTYTIPAGYHNGSGKVTASSCPTCLGRIGPASSSNVSYSQNMTLDADSYYLIDGSAWSNVNGSAPNLSFSYGDASKINKIFEHIDNSSHNGVYRKFGVTLIYVKEATTFKLNISNHYTGSARRSVAKLSS